jgi:drug/metabolite transporter (DMT)-like permease
MTSRKADAALLLVAIIWGIAFVAQRLGSAHMTPLSFNAARFIVGGGIVAIVATLRRPSYERPKRWLTKQGSALGIALAVAAMLQQQGVPLTTTANLSFLTIMNVVFVPLLGFFVGHRLKRHELFGAVLAVVGAYVMSVGGEFSVHPGDWWVLASAIFWAIHIILIGRVSFRQEALPLAAQQFLVCGVLSALGAFVLEDWANQQILAALPALLFSGVVSVAIAYTLQLVAQPAVTPSHAVIILSLEGVFGALAGWILCGEAMSARGIIGASVITAGVIIAQLRTRAA